MCNLQQIKPSSRWSGARLVWAILLAMTVVCFVGLADTTAYAEDVPQALDGAQAAAPEGRADEGDGATAPDATGDPMATTDNTNEDADTAGGAEDDSDLADETDELEAAQTDEPDDAEQDEPEPTDPKEAAEKLLDQLAQAHAGDLADGTYAITSLLDAQLSLDVYKGSTSNGADIILWTAKVAANQRWIIESAGGGYVVIRSSSSGRVLDIPRGVAYAGAGIVQWSRGADDARNQLWIIVRQADGSFKIVSAQPGPAGELLVLDVRGGKGSAGANLCIYTEHGRQAANQSWSIKQPWDCQVDALALASKNDLPDGTYYIASKLGSELVLNIRKASAAAGADIVVWPKTPAAHETWLVTHDAQGYATITSAFSGLVLDVSGGKATSGAKVVQWSQKATGARNQKWVIVRESDGSYTITSALQERQLALDVYGGKAKAGASLILFNCKKGATNQRFAFDEAAIEFAHALQVRNGSYAIETCASVGKVLDVNGGKLSAGRQVTPWNEKLRNNANQVWQLTHDTTGFIHLKIGDGSVELGLKNGVATLCKESHPWIFETVDNGQFVLRDITTEACLSSSGTAVAYTGELNEAPAELLWRLKSSRVVEGNSNSLSAYRNYKLMYDANTGKTYCTETKTGSRCYGYHRIGKTDLHFDEFSGAMQDDGLELLARKVALYASSQVPTHATILDASGRTRILGDSISTGWGAANTISLSNGPVYARIKGVAWRQPNAEVPTWANELRSYVEKSGGELVNASAPGKGFSWFATNLDAIQPEDDRYDLTIVSLGTNDRSSTPAQLRADASAVIDRALATSKEVIVILPPPVKASVGVTSVSRTIASLCDARGIQTIDLTSLFYPLGISSGLAKDALFADSLHPSMLGQAVMWGAVGTGLGIL